MWKIQIFYLGINFIGKSIPFFLNFQRSQLEMTLKQRKYIEIQANGTNRQMNVITSWVLTWIPYDPSKQANACFKFCFNSSIQRIYFVSCTACIIEFDWNSFYIKYSSLTNWCVYVLLYLCLWTVQLRIPFKKNLLILTQSTFINGFDKNGIHWSFKHCFDIF